MSYKKFQTYFFIALLSASLLLTLAVFQSYLVLLAFGGVFAILARPLFLRFERYLKSETAAAFLTITVVASLIFVPTALFVAQLTDELGKLFSNIKGYLDYQALNALLDRYVPEQLHAQVPAMMQEGAKLVSATAQLLSNNLLAFFSNLFGMVFGLLVVVISAYYLLKDGTKIKKELLVLSPLGDTHDEQVFRRVVTAVRAVFMGTLIVGAAKGVLSGIAFWLTGVPAPLFWGTMTGLASFVPMVGSAIVLVPAILYLFAIGKINAAIILAIVSVAVIGTIDNFIQPKFVESKTSIHPLLVLLSILGGLQFYGFAGFILGPLTLAVSMALLEIYKKEFRRELGSDDKMD